MANDGTVKIGVELEEKEFENGIKDLNKKSQSLAKELKEVDKALKLDPKNIELATQKQDLLSQAVSETTKKLEVLKKAEADAAKSPSSDKTAANYRALQREIAKAEAELKNYNSALSQNSSEAKTASNATDKLERETKQYGDEADKATDKSEKLKSSLSKIGSVAKSAVSVAAGAITGVTAALGAGVKAGIDYNKQMETYTTNFEVMLGDAELAANKVNELKELAAKTPFELADLAQSTQTLLAFNVESKDTTGILKMLGDISLGDAQKLESLTRAYGKMNASQKVTLEDLNIMIDAGFNPLLLVAEKTGESMTDLYDRVSEGEVAVSEITEAMKQATSEGGQFYQGMEKASQTFEGMVSTLKDNANELVGNVVKPLFTSITSELLPGAIDAVGQLSTAFQEGGIEGLVETGSNILSDILIGIVDKLPDVIDVAIQILTALITGITENIDVIAEAALEIIMSLSMALLELLPQILEAGLQLIIALATGITQQIPTLIPTIFRIITQIVETLTNPDTLSQLIMVAIQLILTLAQALVNEIPTLISYVPLIIQNVVMTLIQLLPQLIPVAFQLIMTLASALINYIPTLLTYIPQIISAIIGAFAKTDWGQIGKDILDGLAEGLIKGIGVVVDAAKNIANKTVDTFKNLLGIHSPSTVAKGFGINWDEGFAGGIDDGKKKIEKAFKNLKITDKFKKTLPDVQAGINGRLQLATAGIGSSGSTSRIETVKTINRNTTQRVEIVAKPAGIYDVVQAEEERRGKKL